MTAVTTRLTNTQKATIAFLFSFSRSSAISSASAETREYIYITLIKDYLVCKLTWSQLICPWKLEDIHVVWLEKMFDKRVITFTAFTGGRRTHTSSLIYVQKEMMQAFLFFFFPSLTHTRTHTNTNALTYFFVFCFSSRTIYILLSFMLSSFFVVRCCCCFYLFIYLFIPSFIHLFDDKSRLPYPYVKPTNVHHRWNVKRYSVIYLHLAGGSMSLTAFLFLG